MRKSLINIIIFFLLSVPALPSSADIIYFKNGGELRCSIVKETDEYLILQVKSGKIKILKTSIEEIKKTQPLKQPAPKSASAEISSDTIEEIDSLIKGDAVPQDEEKEVVEAALEDIADMPEYSEPAPEKDSGSVKSAFLAENMKHGLKTQIDPQKIQELQAFFQDNIALVLSIALLVFLVILFISMSLNGIYIKIYSRLIVKRFIPFGKTILFQLKFFAFEIFIGILIGILSVLLGFSGVRGVIGFLLLWAVFVVILIWYFFSLSNREFGFSFMETLLMAVIYIVLYAAFSLALKLLLSGVFIGITA
ncbi:MAG: hypothetical protein PHO00_02360 [bacterium]|nr:hypothetical protein [bacterium]